DALARLEVEVDPRVHAPVAEVAVEDAVVAEPVVERAEITEVAAEPLRGHRRVLPALPRVLLPRDERARPETRLPHPPDARLQALLLDEAHVHDAGARACKPPSRVLGPRHGL